MRTRFALALFPVLLFGVLLPLGIMWGQNASGSIGPRASAPSVAYNWCSVPHKHGDICVQAKGVAAVSGSWNDGRGHKLRAVRVPGRFMHERIFQLHVAGRPGKCLGSNPGNPTGMVTGCGPGGVGTVLAITGPLTGNFPALIISRYWTQFLGHGADPRWVLSITRRGHLLRWKPDGSTRYSQYWAPCAGAVCGTTGQPA